MIMHDVLTDCPLTMDDQQQDKPFSGFGHCGQGTLDWDDYITLYDLASWKKVGSMGLTYIHQYVE